jgi:hypothetical protein
VCIAVANSIDRFVAADDSGSVSIWEQEKFSSGGIGTGTHRPASSSFTHRESSDGFGGEVDRSGEGSFRNSNSSSSSSGSSSSGGSGVDVSESNGASNGAGHGKRATVAGMGPGMGLGMGLFHKSFEPTPVLHCSFCLSDVDPQGLYAGEIVTQLQVGVQ